MRKKIYKTVSAVIAGIMTAAYAVAALPEKADAAEDTVVLRICSWEEYIDEGGWEEDEVIDLESGDVFGENSMIEDFQNWYREVYGKNVRVEYSCFGTNEELYSQLTLGDTFDLVCPSDYMIMKLMAEDALEPLSESFFDKDKEYNYYIQGVSPYIREVFDDNRINGEAWSKYAAGFMWGVTGFVYNPDEVSEEEAGTWSLLLNSDYYRQVTIKDNVRDALFPTLGILNRELLMSEEFINSSSYSERLAEIMNDTGSETVKKAEAMLKDIRDNVYSFETDSGKSDMVTGKVLASLQWSGDGVFSLDQAEEDGVYLNWAVPEECTNLWFDGWVMLKSGISGSEEKKQAAEAFINFVSRTDNAVRNMYYIGYTSAIAGGDSPLVYEYAEWCYGAEEDEEAVVEYPVGYFFSGDNSDEDYIIVAPEEQLKRQLSAQYPSEDVIGRSAVMGYFDKKTNAEINQMWINVRCFNLSRIMPEQWRNAGIAVISAVLLALLFVFRKKIFRRHTKAID